jgi:hypothetical protein
MKEQFEHNIQRVNVIVATISSNIIVNILLMSLDSYQLLIATG